MSSDADPTPIADGTSEPSSQEVVQSFIAALERLDPWKTATNKERFEKMLLGMFKETTRFEVEFFDIHERGDGVVYTDRLDIVEGGGMSMELPVQGEFRVRDGLVTEWVDRFSWAKVIGDIARSLPGIIKHRLGR
jgi:limonene-1,2-epoxide hydrolase